MRSVRWLVVAGVVAGLADGAMAQREGRGRRGGPPQEDLLEVLVRECKLPAQQQEAVKAKIKARDEALAKWDAANGEKVAAAEAAAKEARSGGDADKKKQTSAALRELRTAREQSAAEASAAVLATLTDDQKAAWGAYELYKSLAGRYRRVELSEEQIAKVKLACRFAAKDIAGIDPDDSKAKRVKGEVNKKLQWAINALVLNDEQRTMMAAAPKRGGAKKKNQQ